MNSVQLQNETRKLQFNINLSKIIIKYKKKEQNEEQDQI